MRRALVFVLALAACGGSTEITTEDYDQSCEIANTCQVVFVGDVCGCPCEVDAISYTEEVRWAAERSRKQARCEDLLTCQPCPSVQLTCDAGTCAAELGDGTVEDEGEQDTDGSD